MKRFTAQLRTEVMLTLRNGEQLLLTLGIPVLLLVFFSLVDVLPTDTADRIALSAASRGLPVCSPACCSVRLQLPARRMPVALSTQCCTSCRATACS